MRTLLKVTIIGAVALIATPSLALTVSSAPSRDQAAHLNQSSSPNFAFGSNVRGSFVDSGRPLGGMSYSGSGPAFQSGTSFDLGGGAVSTRVYRDEAPSAGRLRMLDDAPATRLDLLEPAGSARLYGADRGELLPRRR